MGDNAKDKKISAAVDAYANCDIMRLELEGRAAELGCLQKNLLDRIEHARRNNDATELVFMEKLSDFVAREDSRLAELDRRLAVMQSELFEELDELFDGALTADQQNKPA